MEVLLAKPARVQGEEAYRFREEFKKDLAAREEWVDYKGFNKQALRDFIKQNEVLLKDPKRRKNVGG